MELKTRQAITTLNTGFDFPEDRVCHLVSSRELSASDLYRIMTNLNYIWSPTHHVWMSLGFYTSLDAARRALSAAGKEWSRARLEWLMIQCGMLSERSAHE